MVITSSPTSLPAVNSNSSDARLLDPLDETDRLLQLEPVNYTKHVTGGTSRLPQFKQLIGYSKKTRNITNSYGKIFVYKNICIRVDGA